MNLRKKVIKIKNVLFSKSYMRHEMNRIQSKKP